MELGKKLAWLLFHPIYNGSFYKFALQTTHTYSNRGMSLEEELNETNQYYLTH
ncbi:DUF2515 domain-containing protein, partial [Bacillus thuringiensis]|nr:DUF2515 domain-containing protein [Bacillus thuringiensis]